MTNATRSFPNILITGTPCTGKTTLSEQLASEIEYTLLNVNQIAKEHNFYDGFDEEFDSHFISEDKLLDYMEDKVSEGKCIVDYHGCDFFPERWFDLVIVLSSNTEVLYDRLVAREYSEHKIAENMECEIMKVIYTEAFESYKPEIIHELESNSVQDMENNIEFIKNWISEFMQKDC